MKLQLTKEQISQIISIVISALIALLAVFGYDVGIMQPRLATLSATLNVPVVGSQTLTKFDALQVGKLTVGSAATFNSGSTAAFNGNVTTAGYFTPTNLYMAGYPVVYSSAGTSVYVGNGTITGTSVLTTSTHGLATIRWATCQLTAAPAAGIAAYMCEPSWSGTTVTFTNYTITPSVTTAAGAITYAIFGSP